MTLDSAQIVYVDTNQTRVTPFSVDAWTHNLWKGDVPIPNEQLNQVEIRRKWTYFLLRYRVDANPEIKFSLSVERISQSGRPVAAPAVFFEPADIKSMETFNVFPTLGI